MSEKDGYQVGDIVESSWGYDQTNIDYYRIVKRTESTVWVRKVQTRVVESVGWAIDKVAPGDDVEGAPVLRRKLYKHDDVPVGLSIHGSFGWASAYDGGTSLRTSYA